MKTIAILLAITLLPGCVCNLAWRGVIYTTDQRATTEGKIENKPASGDVTISAEKATDIKADVPLNK